MVYHNNIGRKWIGDDKMSQQRREHMRGYQRWRGGVTYPGYTWYGRVGENRELGNIRDLGFGKEHSDEIEFNDLFSWPTVNKAQYLKGHRKQWELDPHHSSGLYGQRTALGRSGWSGIQEFARRGGVPARGNTVGGGRLKHDDYSTMSYPNYLYEIDPYTGYGYAPWVSSQQRSFYPTYSRDMIWAGMDPYSVLALLSFLVFLFYVIFNILTNNGNGKRSFKLLSTTASEMSEALREKTQIVWEALDKFGEG